MKPSIKITPPGPKAKKVIQKDSHLFSPMTREYGLVVDHGKGVNIWDPDGNRYLDFMCGISVNSLGHGIPDVQKAAREQLSKEAHVEFSDFYAEPPVRYAEEILKTIRMSNMQRMFFVNSGSEAIECALKLSRYNTRRTSFISFLGAFHGRTYGALSLNASKAVHKAHMGPFLPVIHVPYDYPYRSPFGDHDNSYEDILSYIDGSLFKTEMPASEIAAMVVEPIQGEGGVIVPRNGFLKGIQKICNQHGILFVVDEIQTGIFRTGTYLCSQQSRLRPDIITLAKALGGGLPLGATIASKKIFSWEKGAHGTTFGGNNVASAAGLATLKLMKRKKIGNKVMRDGKYIMKFLKDLQTEQKIIGEVRGKGLMIGMEFVKDKKKTPHPHAVEDYIKRCFKKGLILQPAGKSTVRLLPPFTLTKEDIDSGLEIMRDSFVGLR
jgi:4-aminobutyrate aminotransferase